MHLGDGGGGHGIHLKLGKEFGHRAAQSVFDDFLGFHTAKGRHPILQPGQLHGDIIGQQIPPGGEHLAELDEHRPQGFQRQTQPLTARGAGPHQPAGGKKQQQKAQIARDGSFEDKGIEALEREHTRDLEQAKYRSHCNQLR